MARALLVLIRRVFQLVPRSEHSPSGWIARRATGSEAEQAHRRRAEAPRGRRLSDAELVAFWRHAHGADGSTGRVARSTGCSLQATGLRLNEAAGLSWPEVQGDVIIIPPSRTKAKDGKAHEHLVPITAAIQEVIGSLPRHQGRGASTCSRSLEASALLSATGLIKADLDGAHVEDASAAMARRRGEDHEHVTLPSLGQPRSAPNDPQRNVGPLASRPMSTAVLAHRQGGIDGHL